MADVPPKKRSDELLPDELFIEAKRIANFRGFDWPSEFSPDQISALMAGGWKGEFRQGYRDKSSLVTRAIQVGRLSVRIEKIPGKTRVISHRDVVGCLTGTFHQKTEATTTRRFISRQACAEWLNERGAKPRQYAHIDEWLRVGGIILGESLPGGGAIADENGKLSPAQQDRADCQEKCIDLWRRHPGLPITGPNGVSKHCDLLPYTRKYSVEWVEGCAREVAPPDVKGRRGRPKKISDQTEK